MSSISFKTAYGYVRRSPFQALAATFVLVLTFFVATLLSILVYSSEQALRYYETRPQVIAFLKDEAAIEEVTALQDDLTRDTRFKNVVYISKEDALEIYKNATSDNPLLSELVDPSIFPASIEFSLTDLSYLEGVISELEANDVIDEVGYSASVPGGSEISGVVNNLRQITRYIRLGGGGFVGLQLLSSFLVLIVIISMRLSARKDEIKILNLIGAKPAFIRRPIMIEALVYAVAGVIMGWLLSLLVVLYATPSIISYFGEVPVLPKDTIELLTLFGIVLGVEIVIGIVLALAGSVIAVTRAQSKIR